MAKELHPVGLHEAEVLDHAFFEAGTGTVQLGIVFQTSEGIITAYLPFTDAAAEYSLKKVAAIGYTGALEDLNNGEAMVGMKCKITVEHEEDLNGELREKVAWINPLDYEGGLKRSDKAAANVKRFNALFKKIANKQPVASAAGGDGLDDADIPF